MSWILRPIVWFATASMLTTVLGELTHALVAYALGVPSTLFNYWVDLDLTEAQAAIAANGLHVPMVARYAATAIGMLTLAAVLCAAGRVLRQWVPTDLATARGSSGVVVVPVVIATAVVILANLPSPGVMGRRIGEAS